MDAVIPAAGEGTRLRPLTDDRPKGLIEVYGKPLLTHCFEQLLDVTDIGEFIVIVGYRKADIIAYYGDEFQGTPIRYVHQREQLGLGHAVSLAESYIDTDFIVHNGDNIARGNLEAAISRQQRSGIDAALLVDRVPEAEAKTTGVVQTDDTGRVMGIIEKPDNPPSRLVTTGFYVLPPEVFAALEIIRPSERGEYELTDAVDLLAQAGMNIKAISLDGWRVNINARDDIRRAERLLSGEEH